MQNIVIDASSNASVVVSSPQQATPTPSPQDVWQRPSDWLPLPEVDGSQQIYAVLFAVDNTNYNKAYFYSDDNVIIDWGDGSIENYSGSEATHDYVFNSIPSSTQTTEGYRQVIITITPQSGNNLTSIYGDGVLTSGALEVIASGPFLNEQNSLSGQKRLQHAKMLCKIATVSDCASLVSLEFGYESVTVADFSYNPNLKYISNFSTTNLINDQILFLGCSSLINLPTIDYSVFTTFNSAFKGCSSITTTPPIVVTGTPDMYQCFSGCVNLYKANIIGTPGTIEKMFEGCVNLLEIPAMDLRVAYPSGNYGVGNVFCDFRTREFKAFGMKNTLEFNGFADQFFLQRFSRATLIELMTNLGSANAGAKLRISQCLGFPDLTNGDKAIATNKGWTIT